MAAEKLSEEKLFSTLELHHNHGTKEGARLSGMSYDGFRSRVKLAQARYPDWKPGAAANPEELPEPLAMRQERKFRDEINKFKREADAAHRELNAIEDFRESIFGLGARS